ncbi:guanine nucleotide binding protein, alpha subunit [Auriculariales sp. MPI-PUGE-AT-0066]|nr:guanine nucleotide binding protein, alpha subunit [Auriculariales sp. MPI-PUGE-AT-0066]
MVLNLLSRRRPVARHPRWHRRRKTISIPNSLRIGESGVRVAAAPAPTAFRFITGFVAHAPPNASFARSPPTFRVLIRVSDAIDTQLRTEREEQRKRRASRPDVKLLLLGQAGSGKSTLLKQFQLYYAPDLLDTQRAAWRPVVYFNVVKAVAQILGCLDENGYFSDRERKDSVAENAEGSTSASAQASSRYGSLFAVQRGQPVGTASSRRTGANTESLIGLRNTLMPLADLESPLAAQLSGGIGVHIPGGARNGQGGGGSSPSSPQLRAYDAYVRPGWQSAFKGKGRAESMRQTGDSSVVPAAEETAAWRIAACKDNIHALWQHPAVQALGNKQLQLEDSAAFFLESIQRIAWPDYVPSVDDVLHVRLQTLGVSEHKFDVNMFGKPVSLCLYDVGGARGQRPRWVPFFDSAHAIIFLAPISAYDQYLEEDRRTNRIDDSLQIWTEICKNPALKDLHLVLFLNKTDVLRTKLEAGIKVNKYITSFGDRPNEFGEVSQYFRAHFLQVHRKNVTGRRVLYSHFTSVIDTKATQTIIVNVADSIMRDYFTEAKLVWFGAPA